MKFLSAHLMECNEARTLASTELNCSRLAVNLRALQRLALKM